MRNVAACAVMVLGGCTLYGGDDNHDVVGPFTGQHHRYVVDGIYLPATNKEARAMGGDLNGDTSIDNQLGMVIAGLASYDDVTNHGPDMCSAGAIQSTIELVADDPLTDPTVSVAFHGLPDDVSVAVGGSLSAGAFRSNPSATTDHPGLVNATLPVFVDADPSTIEITHVEINLEPDSVGGYDAFIHGAVDPKAGAHAAYLQVAQMLAEYPRPHRYMVALLDADHDWKISEDEFVQNSLLVSQFSPDVSLDGKQLLSIGFRAHAVACDGSCSLLPPVDHCHDRETDQDETGLDCGGTTCRECPGGESCAVPNDCQSQQCSNGICAATSCSDGVRDGFESDVDCGGNCSPCAIGQQCWGGYDCVEGSQCVSGHCWSNM